MKPKNGIERIAQLAKVSIGTVDRALHGRSEISETTRERVLRIARQLGYEPNLAARALSKRRRPIRIGVCIPREIHFFYDQLWEGIYDEARRYRDYGIDFVFRALPELGVGEGAELEKVLQSGVHGIVVTPGRPAETTPLINRAEENGVRVVCVSTDAPASNRSSIVCVDPELNGFIAGELMAQFVRPKAKVAIITGMLETEDHSKKCQGFSASFPLICAEGQICEIIEGHEDEDECSLKVSKLLSMVPDLEGIYVSTVNCRPVCKVLENRGKGSPIKLITTDLFREMIPHFNNRTICASIYQRPYQQGRTAINIIAEHLTHQAALPPTNYLNPSIVLQSNVHLFRESRATGNSAEEKRELSNFA